MSGRAFVVERFNWEPVSAERDSTFRRLPGSVRVACFQDAATAEADCRQCERTARAGVNPFTCGGPALHHLTSLDEGRLRDCLLDAGLDPPEPDVPWGQWWAEHSPAMTALQQAKVWQALDKVRLFRVVEGSARLVFAVVEVQKEGTPRPRSQPIRDGRRRRLRAARGNAAGGTPHTPRRTRFARPGRRPCRRLAILVARQPDDQGVWDLVTRPAFFEVAEVELPG